METPQSTCAVQENHGLSLGVSACEAKMTRYLKGWKRILDKDNTNRCNWYEFQARDPMKTVCFVFSQLVTGGGLEYGLFVHVLGISSSQLTLSYFSEG